MTNSDEPTANGTANEPAVTWYDALGMTPKGTCSRHANCPVFVSGTIMSCRICFSEEKSVGVMQRQTFAAVVQELQSNSGHGEEDSSSKAPAFPVAAVLQNAGSVETML